MCAAYMVSYVSFVMSYPTTRNVCIVASTLAALCTRALIEERFLATDPVYRSYMRQVRWRFVPYLY